MERIMLDIMFKLPSLPDVKGCLINQAVIEKGKEPVLLYADDGDFPGRGAGRSDRLTSLAPGHACAWPGVVAFSLR